MADISGMGPVHHIVMYWVVDGGSPRAAVAGLATGIPSGESYVIFEPQELEAVQQATIELIAAGYANLHRLRDDDVGWPDGYQHYSPEEAQQVLLESAAWYGKEYFALSATDEGRALWRALDETYGEAARKASAVADRRYEEFLERHPDFEERRMKYLEDVQLWVSTGEGRQPEFPTYPGEPPPYDDDVPRYDTSKDSP